MTNTHTTNKVGLVKKLVDKNKKKERVGETRTNNEGSTMTIVKYNNKEDMLVRFDSGYETIAGYGNFLKGSIRDRFKITICKIGYYGDGEYGGLKHRKHYNAWVNMIRRCYSEKYPSYKDCSVCEEWHNFQTFAKWYDENRYEIEGEKIELDKDILVKNNKVYSPQTCIFAPKRLNVLFSKTKKIKNDGVIGLFKNNGGFIVRVRIGGRNRVPYSIFKTELEAFAFYKTTREKCIKEVATEYKNKIPKKLYEAIYNYNVEITD